MPAIDYERSWVRLKARLAAKSSWGTAQLYAAMAAVEVECEVPEGQEGFDGTPMRPRALPGASIEDMRRDTVTPDRQPAEAERLRYEPVEA